LLPLETNRLILRDYKSQDWERFHIYGSNSEFSQFEAWGPNSVDETKKFIADMVAQSKDLPRFKFDFAICLKDSDLLIGGCGIRRESQESKVANMGWAINPEFQNKGFASVELPRQYRTI